VTVTDVIIVDLHEIKSRSKSRGSKSRGQSTQIKGSEYLIGNNLEISSGDFLEN
jgi:hypothetical protein